MMTEKHISYASPVYRAEVWESSGDGRLRRFMDKMPLSGSDEAIAVTEAQDWPAQQIRFYGANHAVVIVFRDDKETFRTTMDLRPSSDEASAALRA